MVSAGRRLQGYDLFKLLVAILLLVLIALLLREPSGAPQPAAGPSPTVADAAPPTPTPTATRPPPTNTPAIAAPSAEASVEPGRVALSGSGTPGSRVQVRVDGRAAGEAIVGADGQWSFGADLEAGDHTVVVDALDPAGQAVASAPPLDVSVPAPLAVPVLDPLPGGLSAGQVPLRGSGTPGSRVRVLIDGRAAGEAIVGADGRWSFEADLEAGDHTVVVDALADSGRVAASGEPRTLRVAVASAATPTPALEAREGCDFLDPDAFGEDLGAFWRVERCDTMAYIAQQTRIDLPALIAANPQVQNPDLIFPGQLINLPGR
jgi:hypothetical protein